MKLLPLLSVTGLISAGFYVGLHPTFPSFGKASGCAIDAIAKSQTRKTATYAKYRAMFDRGVQTAAAETKAAHPGMKTGAPLQACLIGDDPSVMAAFMDAMLTAPDGAWKVPNPFQNYQAPSRWTGTYGTAKVITWSFVPDTVSISGGAGEPAAASNLFSTFDSQFSASGGRAKWISLFQAIFDRWSQLTGFTYQRVTYNGNDWDDGAGWGTAGAANARGDIRIGGHYIDGASGTNILAYNYFPQNGDMVIDTSNTWNSSTNNFRFLRNTLGHEHGHGMGQYHNCPINQTKLMEPFLSTAFAGPQQDDIRGAMTSYGDPYEKGVGNNTVANAANLGTVVGGSSVTFGTTPADINFNTEPIPANSSIMSITPSTSGSGVDVDYYKFTADRAGTYSVTMTPVGSTYNEVAQAGDGSCAAGSPVDSLNQGNLGVEVLGTNGTTSLGIVNTGSTGVAKTVTATIPAAGTYYVRVFAISSPLQTQLYTLGFNSTAPNTAVLQNLIVPPTGQVLDVQIRQPGTTTVVQTLSPAVNASGAFTLTPSGLAAGTYDIAIKASHWLRTVVGNVAYVNGSIVGLSVSLLNGDVDGNNIVNINDYALLSDAFNSSTGQTGFLANADLDGNGIININDYSILSDNFTLSGAI